MCSDEGLVGNSTPATSLRVYDLTIGGLRRVRACFRTIGQNNSDTVGRQSPKPCVFRRTSLLFRTEQSFRPKISVLVGVALP